MNNRNSLPVYTEATTPYPRLCAHRGFSTAAPDNSMPAFLAALEIGAQEIEFDIWETADGQVVSSHDGTLNHCSNGSGNICDHTLEELKQLDFGICYGEAFRGTKILTFEEILAALGHRVIMNVEIKSPNLTDPLPVSYLCRIVELVRRYDCADWIYLTCGNDTVYHQLAELAPDIKLCCAGGGTTERRWQIVERAIAFGCSRIQFHKDCMTEEMIRKAHDHGIRCNVFWSDDPEEAARFLDMGIDTILSNNCAAVLPAFRHRNKNQETETVSLVPGVHQD